MVKSFQLGVEKEGLRSTPEGELSQKIHPLSFGSKLTHPYITTDYSEALLEFITGVSYNFDSNIEELLKLHAFCARQNPEEVIWPMSMPCLLPEDAKIPVAHYGSSNVGRLKELYRVGLGHRYGRSMQSIAGLHYNFSLDDKIVCHLRDDMKPGANLQVFRDRLYFKIIRNYRRYNWLLVYLFGASPCVDQSFLNGKKHVLEKIEQNTYGGKYATSLRMGGLGYTSNAQESISICYNGLPTYIKTLEEARLTSYPPYEKIGVKVGGQWRQLNSNLLQIDNEFYSSIRPKHPARSGQSALGALYEGGVEYIELRIMDLDPFEVAGISLDTSRFLHLFVLTCLAIEDDYIDGNECKRLQQNLSRVVSNGRDPALTLNDGQKEVAFKEKALEFWEKMRKVADIIDSERLDGYHHTLDIQRAKIEDSQKTPSYKVLELSSHEGHIGLGRRLALEHFQQMLSYPLDKQYEEDMVALAQHTLAEQLEIENSDIDSFDVFLGKYFDKIKIQWND